ncbi:RibD family protein [Pilimelia columellifera]|uniref:Bacterial bifunctional deaminase-reductase C-terminal domain-containing protein n=1 Tax=Pilimelia columellifera subsp. columellifera TaxID=706583 RepID=A0ABP6ANQ2_9ACTN
MAERPYVLLSCAVSIDGYLDDAADGRLPLSNDEDFDRVDAVRATCDAILVGANTIRRDNPRLLVRSPERRERRISEGRSSSPLKVSVTGRGALKPDAAFFTSGDDSKVVYTSGRAYGEVVANLGRVAEVVAAGDPISLARVLDDLAGRGVRRLMVEGGSAMHTQFLALGLADELHLVIAPFFVGDSAAPRFVTDGRFPNDSGNRASLLENRTIGDCVLLRYGLSDRATS